MISSKICKILNITWQTTHNLKSRDIFFIYICLFKYSNVKLFFYKRKKFHRIDYFANSSLEIIYYTLFILYSLVQFLILFEGNSNWVA